MRFDNPEITVLNLEILDVITTSNSTPTEAPTLPVYCLDGSWC